MYRYRLRPAYGSKELLIEILPKEANKAFFRELYGVLEQINFKVHSVDDLWMNDEVLLSCDSDDGAFQISKDIWDLVFVMAPENPAAIAKIDALLSQSSSFQKEEVGYKDYR